MKTVVILQARMGSNRLPGKVLMRIGDKPVLLHCLDRALRISGADAVCLATSDHVADDAVAEAAAQRPDVALFRGSEGDVLDRYRGAAHATAADVVMRLTCDCPFIDPVVCDAVLKLREQTQSIYASNVGVRDWPHGLDCEAFTRTVLDEAARIATDDYDREHVTPWIRRRAGTQAPHLTGPGGAAAEQRWTLDYPEDLAFMRALWGAMLRDGSVPGWQDLMAAVVRHPEFAKINAVRVAPARIS